MDVTKCTTCKGSGNVEHVYSEYPHHWTQVDDCEDCDGTGYIMDTQTAATREYLVQFDDDMDWWYELWYPTTNKPSTEIPY